MSCLALPADIAMESLSGLVRYAIRNRIIEP
jgi:hypothetical protein